MTSSLEFGIIREKVYFERVGAAKIISQGVFRQAHNDRLSPLIGNLTAHLTHTLYGAALNVISLLNWHIGFCATAKN